jgi:hypothetical protein
MSERRSVRLLAGPSLGVYDVRCFAARGGPGPDEPSRVTQVIVPVGGVFDVHRGRQRVAADAASVVVLEAEQVHRVGHPTTGGDRSLVLVFPPDVMEDALERVGGYGGPVEPSVQLGAHVLAAGLRHGALGEFESEELALGLLDRICTDLDRAHGYRAPGRYGVARVEQVRATLALGARSSVAAR